MQIESQLSTLRIQYTERHPRILALEDMIEGLEEQCAAEMDTTRTSNYAFAGPSGSQPLETNPVYQNLRIQLSTVDVELVEHRTQLESYRSNVERLQRDVDKIAEVETELKQLNRDYNVIEARHQELLRRWEDLQAKNRLDPVTDEVQFRRIEPPFALADPVGPNRPMFLWGVLVMSLGAGGALAFGMHRVHPTFFTRRALTRIAGLPVLGAVTMILEPAEVRKRRLDTMLWLGCYAVLIAINFAVVALATPASLAFRRLIGGVSA